MEGNDIVFGSRGVEDFAGFAGELYGGFVGFGTGVADEYCAGVVHGVG